MKELAKAIYSIRDASGRLDKIALLNKYATLPGFKDTLKFIYNPYIRTGIGATKLNKKRHDSSLIMEVSADCIIDYFTKHQTGDDYNVAMAWNCINSYEEHSLARSLVIAMVTKDLKIGITETTLNTIFGSDFIPKIGCMLGSSYADNKKVKGPFIVTEKLDGHRRILVKENGTSTLYTRSGHIDEGLVDIEAEATLLPDNMAYDSEFLAIGDYPDSIALRQATSSIMNSKGARRGVTMNVFDMIPVDEFKSGISKQSAFARKIDLCSVFNAKESRAILLTAVSNYSNEIFKYSPWYAFKAEYIKMVPILGVAYDEQDILSLAAPIWARKFEGVMLNTFDGKYEIKRSKALLKVKNVIEMQLPIVDCIEGTGKYAGMLGAFAVAYKGESVGVGSGLTDQQRVDYWKHRQHLIGVNLELDTFGESTDKSGKVSLNCGIFKRLMGEVE